MTQDPNLSPPRYLLAPWERDVPDLPTRERRAGHWGIALSLLVHALVLFIAIHRSNQPEGVEASQPIAVRLQPPSAAPAAIPVKSKPIEKPKPKAAVIALSQPSANSRRLAVEPPTPKPPVENQPDPAPDMISMLNAARARRAAVESNAARENASAVAGEAGPSENDIAMANINRNLQRGQGGGGTGGVFEILDKGTRTGRFAFNGWTLGVRSNWREVIDVDAGLGGNIEVAIVRRMIELIRSHYSGDFYWESHRLGRVVTMSARPQDTAELEAFMLKEFFDDRREDRRIGQAH